MKLFKSIPFLWTAILILLVAVCVVSVQNRQQRQIIGKFKTDAAEITKKVQTIDSLNKAQNKLTLKIVDEAVKAKEEVIALKEELKKLRKK